MPVRHGFLKLVSLLGAPVPLCLFLWLMQRIKIGLGAPDRSMRHTVDGEAVEEVMDAGDVIGGLMTAPFRQETQNGFGSDAGITQFGQADGFVAFGKAFAFFISTKGTCHHLGEAHPAISTARSGGPCWRGRRNIDPGSMVIDHTGQLVGGLSAFGPEDEVADLAVGVKTLWPGEFVGEVHFARTGLDPPIEPWRCIVHIGWPRQLGAQSRATRLQNHPLGVR